MKIAHIVVGAIVLVPIILRLFYISIGFIKIKSMRKFIPPEVTAESVRSVKIRKSYESPGRVESVYQVKIVARISGYLQNSYFKEGAPVKKGDLLFSIEANEYQNNLSVASADIKKISSQLDFANKQLLRAKELVKQDYIAKAKYDELYSSRNSLAAQLSAARALEKDAKRNLNYTKITSPIDGIIGIIDVTAGNYVTPATKPLTTIYSKDPIHVKFSLSNEDFNSLMEFDGKSNKTVDLYYSNGRKYEYSGTQDFIDNKVDEDSGTVSLRATFKNPKGELLHGQFITTKIYSNKYTDVIIVPQTAVLGDQRGKYVYKLDKNEIAEITYITVDGQYNKYWIVTKGLNVGDRIITSGLQKVIPQKRVKIVKE